MHRTMNVIKLVSVSLTHRAMNVIKAGFCITDAQGYAFYKNCSSGLLTYSAINVIKTGFCFFDALSNEFYFKKTGQGGLAKRECSVQLTSLC